MNTFAPQQRNDRSKAATQTKATQIAAHEAVHAGPHAESQLRLGQLVGGGPRAAAQLRLARMVTQRQEADEEELVQRDEVTDEEETAQLQTDEDEPMQQQTASQEDESLQLKSRGGLPANLKAGLEGLSGVSLDDVKVHYNSAKPSQLHAHAYTQGSEIHVGPGQEKHLPHEAWHAVQQKQGRVTATTQMQGVSINDDHALEREADVMGAKALQMKPVALSTREPSIVRSTETHGPIQMLREIELPEKDYGLGPSREAMEKRVADNINPKQNIATFHFVPRPPLAGGGEAAGEGFQITRPSTGIGMYVTVSERTQAERKINLSHSEHQIISGELEEMRKAENFPKQNVIDWVYTERPACPDVWYGHKFIANGCRTELKKIEELQKYRVWDVGPRGSEPYGLRDDLEITVFSTFESSSEIRKATIFAPIRSEIYRTLVINLTALIGDEAAKELADRLPSWSDYDLNLSRADQEGFRRQLLNVSGTIFRWMQMALNLRQTRYANLVQSLTDLYQDHYATTGSEEEYDTSAFDSIEDDARELANTLPVWSDYDPSFDASSLRVFNESLVEEAGKILEAERARLSASAEEEPELMSV
jgi:hypothetical protein